MLEKKEVIVGLDISSSVIGISFFDSTMKLISLQAIKFKKEKLETYENYFNKITFFEKEIEKISNIQQFNIKEFRVEANAKAFAAHSTTAHTLFTLAKINAMICFSIWKKFPNAKIKEIQVSSARKNIGFKPKKSNKLSKTKSKKIKDQVFDFVLESQKEVIKFLPKKILKAGPNKGKEVYEEHAKDMIDAYVIAKGGK